MILPINLQNVFWFPVSWFFPIPFLDYFIIYSSHKWIFFLIFGLLFFCFSALARETSWKIKINDKKKKLMENILLYEEDKLNSSELFES